MIDKEHEKILRRQHYYITGDSSAVKICSWTKNSIKDKGVCYKEKFYGIRSHLCCQISTTIGYCQNRCLICWRPMEYTETKEMKSPDSPDEIIENSIKGQQVLLSGLGGIEGINREKLKSSDEPMHFAISLSGEPLMYPKLGELIKKLHDKGKSTFVVSNGMLPDKLKNLEEYPTQLYISLDAPTEELLKKIDNPTFDDAWERLMQTLDILATLKDKTRTNLRITLVKDMNMIQPEKWAELIKRANPLFIEVKAYMYVGFSRDRLKMENMPRHSEVKDFAEEIAKYAGYKFIDEQAKSRVVLLMKNDFEGRIMKFE